VARLPAPRPAGAWRGCGPPNRGGRRLSRPLPRGVKLTRAGRRKAGPAGREIDRIGADCQFRPDWPVQAPRCSAIQPFRDQPDEGTADPVHARSPNVRNQYVRRRRARPLLASCQRYDAPASRARAPPPLLRSQLPIDPRDPRVSRRQSCIDPVSAAHIRHTPQRTVLARGLRKNRSFPPRLSHRATTLQTKLHFDQVRDNSVGTRSNSCDSKSSRALERTHR
jgi:hypothetical protein